jgi:quercetin dioxygenase-like cupin family protein
MDMTDTDTAQTEQGNPLTEEWGRQVSETVRRSVIFNLDEVEWTQVTSGKDGEGTGTLPPALIGKVDFEKYYAHGMWTAFIDAGAFNILGVKLAPDYTIQRHHHNFHQLVLVHEGEAWQGNRRFVPGDGYFTRANHPYSVTAGPEGSIAFEVRFDPIVDLETIWDEDNPDRWVHGRRPGGPAADLAEEIP